MAKQGRWHKPVFVSRNKDPGPVADDSDGANRRRYPRSPTQVKVRVEARGKRGVSFEAHLPSFDVSIGGIFLESEFFVKLGTELRVVFQLPDLAEEVEVEGTVVREQRASEGNSRIRSGFAIEFTRFLNDAKMNLASYFLAPEIREFVKSYRKGGRHKRIKGEQERLVDAIVGWEMIRLERGGFKA